ncbi:MAG: hypothetical protein IJT87_06985 [Ruminiclostridium sp.]|nr:hypothetical protein [Ruminiclostridium sp.]
MSEVLFSICAASIMTAIYRYLAPTEKFGSQIKLLLACFFVLTVTGVVGRALGAWELPDLAKSDGSYTDYSVRVRQLTAEETAKELRGAIRERLTEKGIRPEKIYIDVNISDTGSISIIEIRLVFDDEGYALYADRAVALVRQMTGAKTKVTAETVQRLPIKEREGQ